MPALDACQGVAVTLNVKEGAVYAWDRAEWSGTSALGTDVLDKAMGMKTGEAADATKIDAGLREVHAAYGHQGYIAERATFEPRLDDASHRAVFAIAVDEGVRFMGTLEFAGIRESDATMLGKKWRLKPRTSTTRRMRRNTSSRDPALRTSGGTRADKMHLDSDQRLVSLKIVFK